MMCAERLTPGQVKELKELVSAMEKAAKAKDFDSYYPLNLKLHEFIIDHSGNPVLASHYRDLVKMLHLFRARSLVQGLKILGAPDVRVIGPRTLIPTGIESMGVRVFHDMREGLAGCDVVVMLRLQNERMRGALLPSAQEFFKHYGLTDEKLARANRDAIVMHPGPMNRGVEIDSPVADGPQSVILPQVTFGIAVRMAVMSIVAGN